TGDPDPAPAKTNGVNGFPENTPVAEMNDRQAAAYWKYQSRKHESTSKSNASAAQKLADIEAAQLSEQEKLAAAKEAAEQRAVAAERRAVDARIAVLASPDFADPSDAEAALDAADYIREDGTVDENAIKTRLAELLDAKPHWRKQNAPTTPPVPGLKPDPAQGRPGKGEVDFAKADNKQFADELAKYGLNSRST
ncbi:MAG: hypothetical protein M3443_11015, partial [Actinomycetota bacterium]|nr:hypothetical protein [Actinomycetota bacterium]